MIFQQLNFKGLSIIEHVAFVHLFGPSILFQFEKKMFFSFFTKWVSATRLGLPTLEGWPAQKSEREKKICYGHWTVL